MKLRRLAVLAVVVALLAIAGPLVGTARGAAAYTGLGFDTCGAPPTSTMSAWLASSYRAVGVYIGGINRACGDGNLSAGWVTTVQSQGWRMIPTYVGRQAACAFQPGLQSIDPTTAASEGGIEADDAANRAANLGLGANTPIYFDMEAYGKDPVCVQAVQVFLAAWTIGLHRRGYIAGLYGSSASTIANQAAIIGNCGTVPVDAIWFANWNSSLTVFGDPYFPDSTWADHRRLHQYRGSYFDAYGGATLNIDGDYLDGPVAGPAGTDSLRVATGITGTPAMIATAAGPLQGTLSGYARGTDGALYTTWQSNVGGCWHQWERIGGGPPAGNMQASPVVVAATAARFGGALSAYAAAADGALYTTWQPQAGATWAGWQRIGGGAPGGAIQGSPTVVAATAGPYSGALSAYAVAADGGLYTTWQVQAGGTWAGWQRIGGGPPSGGMVGSPAVLAVPVGPYAGTLSAYATGADGWLYTTWQVQSGGTWAGWQRIGGTPPVNGIHGSPAVVMPASGPFAGAASAYARGGDGGLYTTWQVRPGGVWADWQRIGGGPPPQGIQGSPAVVVSSRGPVSGTLSAFARAGDGLVYMTRQAAVGGTWVSWQLVGGTPPAGSLTDPPSVVESTSPASPGALSLYGRGADAALYTAWQNQAGGTWSPWFTIGWTLPAVR